MTRGELVSRVQAKIGGAVTADQIDEWSFDAVVDILSRTKLNTTISTVTGSGFSNTGFATIFVGALSVTEIWLTSGGQDYELERRSPADIIAFRRSANISGPARYYALDGDNLMFYPPISSTDTLNFIQVPMPTQVSGDSDNFSTSSLGGIPQQFHKAIEFYVLREAADWDDDASSGMGELYDKRYEREIIRIKKHMRDLGGRRLNRIIPNRSRRPFIPHDNSMDVG